MTQRARQYEDALQRYISGARPSDLARELGVTQQAFHAYRVRRGVAARNGKAGDKHWNWKGGRCRSHGYIKIAVEDDHLLAPERDKDGYVLEHRSVMAEMIGRPLYSFETVHHKDGQHDNNAADNLQLRIGAHGPGVVLECAQCGSGDLRAVDL